MRHGLVLGGGGLIGMGFHAGVLKALDEWGIDVARSDVMVGTSAGAVIASYLAAGWRQSDFYDYAHGRHPDSTADPDEQHDEVRRLFTPLWSNPAERVRRSIGSLFTLASSRGYWRSGASGGVPNRALRRAFPSGLYSTAETRERLSRDLPEEWPRDDLYLCAADLYAGRRIAFGTPGTPEAALVDAVMASTAIPGVFPPVKVGDRHYVDGGVITATSLDLAAEAGCDTILCIAPLGYRAHNGSRPLDPRAWPSMLVRTPFARALSREVKRARAEGIDVLVIRPWIEDLGLYGTNAMRNHDRVAVSDAARRGALRVLEENAGHPALDTARPEAASG